MFSQSALTELASPNLAPFLSLDPVNSAIQCALLSVFKEQSEEEEDSHNQCLSKLSASQSKDKDEGLQNKSCSAVCSLNCCEETE